MPLSRRQRRWRLGGLLAVALAFPLFAWSFSLEISAELLAWIEQRHGTETRQRVERWRTLMTAGQAWDEGKKLLAVNDFFNELVFIDDLRHWRQADYWATPLEFLTSGGGDCEDFAIAKYFTLKAMGVDEAKLRMTYVKALTLNQPHMVVTYYDTPEAMPLVLDNLADAIRPASERNDLAPVYSFNGSGLWLARERGQGKRAGDADRMGLWQDLLLRLSRPVAAMTPVRSGNPSK